MKKFLALSLILAATTGLTVQAADDSTYTDRLLNQYTKNLTETEIKLREEQAAREVAIEKKRQERDKAVLEKLEQIDAQREKNRIEMQKRVDEINRQAEQGRAEINKRLEAQDKAIEEAKKQADEISKSRKERIENKKQLWKELISE